MSGECTIFWGLGGEIIFKGNVEITKSFAPSDDGFVAAIKIVSPQTAQESVDEFDVRTAEGFKLDLVDGFYKRE